ncbi:uncharacterized protein LOC143146613 [Ptiloglossa arizonensis]|uniref:uncharacterized protein LOC143146613 n=1 Tax=Ptiloglossa arizonensis TaxID=3350558 RepID=UPI003FA0D5E2
MVRRYKEVTSQSIWQYPNPIQTTYTSDLRYSVYRGNVTKQHTNEILSRLRGFVYLEFLFRRSTDYRIRTCKCKSSTKVFV